MKIRFFLAISIIVTLFTSCEKKVEGWVINGYIDGFGNDTITFLRGAENGGTIDIPIIDGKFTISGKSVAEPSHLALILKNSRGAQLSLYAENGVIEYRGMTKENIRYNNDGTTYTFKSIENVSFKGGVVNRHNLEVVKTTSAIQDSMQKITNDYRRGLTKLSKSEYELLLQESYNKIEDVKKDFIKRYPDSFIAASLANSFTKGITMEELAKLIAMLSPENKYSPAERMRKILADNKDVKISEVITASNVSYKVDNSFKGDAYIGAKYLGVMSDNNIVALNNDKTIDIIGANGTKIKSFAVSKSSIPSTMAVDKDNNIYVLVPEEKEFEKTYRGKTTKQKQIVGYTCDIYDANGKKKNSLKIEGIKSATGARVVSNKILIADMGGRNISIFNTATGAKDAEIKDMRPCCGILDFDINDKHELLVANLGAFRVQAFDLSGKKLLAFGSRGQGISEFHGCCNPVSVAYLSNGAIVTVEKDPTRVKVYSKEGAKTIAGIDEMVKGCSYIPMTVDRKDNLYLASPTKGIVRCVAI